MSRGRIVLGVAWLLMFLACSQYVPQTVLIERDVRHVGNDSIFDWRVPGAEGTEISYDFELDRLGNEEKYPYAIGFLFKTELTPASLADLRFILNGDTLQKSPWSGGSLPLADSVKEDFMQIWRYLLDEDTAYFNDLERMIDLEDFYPALWGYMDEGLLEKGMNTITLIPGLALLEDDSVTDYMIASIIISNDEIMKQYPTSLYRDLSR
jgi:hypothetical protein